GRCPMGPFREKQATSAQFERRSNDARALMSRFDAEHSPGLRFDDPLELRPIRCGVVASPADRVPFHVAALELSGFDLALAADDEAAVRKRQLDLDRTYRLSVERLLREV